MSRNRVVVVGTTSDYIDAVSRRLPGRAVFLTDRVEREGARERPPPEGAEVLCDLASPGEALAALQAHLRRWRIMPSGVACYDDESMALAVVVAGAFSLPAVPAAAVAACRSKLACKLRWRRAGLPCPQVAEVRRAADAVAFRDRVGGPIVLKPLTGSGSELTFLCADAAECIAAFGTLQRRLAEHRDARMYAPQGSGDAAVDPRQVFAVEEFVRGREHSCDFVVDGDRVEILRLANKLPAADESFGTTMAYVVPGELPSGMGLAAVGRQLGSAARALGVERAMCMVDFIVRDGEALLLELAPRPGGDCLPPLVRRSCGLDMLAAALDFAERRPVAAPPREQWRRLVGLRLFATRPGTLARVDTSGLVGDPRVLECTLKHGPGHRVVLPPEDYDSRILGHVVFDPEGIGDLEAACLELAARVEVEMEPAECPTATTC